MTNHPAASGAWPYARGRPPIRLASHMGDSFPRRSVAALPEPHESSVDRAGLLSLRLSSSWCQPRSPQPGVVDRIILVDDGSLDGAAALAVSLDLFVISHPHNAGYGVNQKTCYMEALRDGADVIVMLHPDGQYDPAILDDMVEVIRSGQAEVVLGSRFYTPGGARAGGMPWWRRIANRFLTGYENRVLGLGLTEYHTGYRSGTAHVWRIRRRDALRCERDEAPPEGFRSARRLRCHRRGAERAAMRGDGDHAEALRARARRRFRRLGAARLHAVVRHHEEEVHARRDEDERDHRRDERAVLDIAAVDGEDQAVEVGLAERDRDDRVDHVGHERGDHRTERYADDERDRELNDVALAEEGTKPFHDESSCPVIWFGARPMG